MGYTFSAWLSESVEHDYENLNLPSNIIDIFFITEATEQSPKCPECGGEMILRTNRQNGNQFWGCKRFPSCRGVMGYKAPGAVTKSKSGQDAPTCPECGSLMIKRKSARGDFWGCSQFPSCRGVRQVEEPTSHALPQQVKEQPQPWWIYAVAKQDVPQFKKGTKLALLRPADAHTLVSNVLSGHFAYRILDNSGTTGTLSPNEAKASLESIRDENGTIVQTKQPSLEEINQYLGNGETPEPKDQQRGTIPDERISDEQKKIDAQFSEMIHNPSQSHMMISALAGTGKTTMLKHLAWKYGKPGEKWLYIVFNTKNKVEAKEEFPPFVDVHTTNSFLGDLLQSKDNVGRIPGSERIINLLRMREDNEEAGGKIEKARLIIDGNEFADLSSKLGIPRKQVIDRGYDNGIDKTIKGIQNQIIYHFKEQVLLLANLAKAFSLDPRNKEKLKEGIDKIFEKYDIDSTLSEPKERIDKYSGSYRTQIMHYLDKTLGYSFMEKNFRDEITIAATWLLEKTLPGATSQKHKVGSIEHDLGQFRDFSDDLWFASTYADQIKWPHYDVVLADEVQDFNETQKMMLRKLHDSGAKIVAVGDKNQSIYRFRGADSQAFDNLSQMLGELSGGKDVVRNLTYNFRSRPNIIKFANEESHVKNLVAGRVIKDGNPGVATKYEQTYDDSFDTIRREKQKGSVMPTAYIARTNEPLVHAALQLMGSGIPFVILGKDLAKDLKKHIGRITAQTRLTDSDLSTDLAEKLESFVGAERDAHSGKSSKRAYMESLEEVTKALLAALDQFENESPNGTIGQFKRWLDQRLGGLDVQENERDLKSYRDKVKRENPVVLTTAHKSKGLQFKRVYILRYDLFPHKKAKRPEDLEQEENAKYVSLTRGEDEVHILELEGQPGYKK